MYACSQKFVSISPPPQKNIEFVTQISLTFACGEINFYCGITTTIKDLSCMNPGYHSHLVKHKVIIYGCAQKLHVERQS
jgi:hypothetical protein